MKRKIIGLILTIVVACLMFGSGLYVGAATKNGAGSQNDPVVTLSYLDYRLEKLGSGSGNGGTAINEAYNGFKKVVISRGERYIPGEGGLIILYSGSCTVVGKGLVNLTGANIVRESENVPAYSQMLAPDSSSGVVASEETVLFTDR